MVNGQDPFSGTWKMNAEKSTFDVNHRPSEATMRFERQPDGYLMLAEGMSDGKPVQERPQHFILDGKERPVPDLPQITVISTCPDPNTIHSVAKTGGQTVGEGTYVVSEDGGTLTASVRGIDAQQRPFQITLVWDRR
jgi:hypothetical protein